MDILILADIAVTALVGFIAYKTPKLSCYRAINLTLLAEFILLNGISGYIIESNTAYVPYGLIFLIAGNLVFAGSFYYLGSKILARISNAAALWLSAVLIEPTIGLSFFYDYQVLFMAVIVLMQILIASGNAKNGAINLASIYSDRLDHNHKGSS